MLSTQFDLDNRNRRKCHHTIWEMVYGMAFPYKWMEYSVSRRFSSMHEKTNSAPPLRFTKTILILVYNHHNAIRCNEYDEYFCVWENENDFYQSFVSPAINWFQLIGIITNHLMGPHYCYLLVSSVKMIFLSPTPHERQCATRRPHSEQSFK